MIFGFPAGAGASETRAAATPETITNFTTGDHPAVPVRTGAGAATNIFDDPFTARAGVVVAWDSDTFGQAAMAVRARGRSAPGRPAGESFSY